jgi:hypothetical protein
MFDDLAYIRLYAGVYHTATRSTAELSRNILLNSGQNEPDSLLPCLLQCNGEDLANYSERTPLWQPFAALARKNWLSARHEPSEP